MSIWTITSPGGGVETFEALNITLIGITYAINGGGFVNLRITKNFDDSGGWYASGQLVSVYRDGGQIFVGRVKRNGISASGSQEGGIITIEETWKDLSAEYKEEWAVGDHSLFLPMAILGMDSGGNTISTGMQALDAIDYARSRGAYLQTGAVPSSVTLWPSEAKSMTCEQVLNKCMDENMDWFGRIAHGASPPVLDILSYSSLGAQTINIESGTITEFDVGQEDDQRPDGVEITYLTTVLVDTDVYRYPVVDTAGDVNGRKVISALVELSGGQSQVQKQAIQTMTIPESEADAKPFLKKLLKALRDDSLDDAWEVTQWERELVEDDEADQPPPINPHATRINVGSVNELPRALVRGQIADWMRVKVGEVSIKMKIGLTTSGASSPTAKKKLKEVLSKKRLNVTGTNAVTKIYHGRSQWQPGDEVPVGLAAAVFAKASAPKVTGSITIEAEEIPNNYYVGSKINLVNGGTPIIPNAVCRTQEISMDGENWSMRLTFGPPPDLDPNDWIDIQRRLARRIPKWYSPVERGSAKMGSEFTPSAAGDTVTGYDLPKMQWIDEMGGDDFPAFYPILETDNSGGSPAYHVTVTPGDLVNEVTGAAVGVDNTGTPPVEAHEDDKIYLECIITDQLPGACTVKCGPESGWPDYPSVAEFSTADPYKQTFARCLLGEMREVEVEGEEAQEIFLKAAGNKTLRLGNVDQKLAWVFA